MQHKLGNLITLAEEGHFDVIVHGCNCQNTMGSGIAREIRQRYPGAYEADTEAHKRGCAQPGLISSFYTEQFWIVNAYTQKHYLPRGLDHFEYEAFDKILDTIMSTWPSARIGFPYIGMGLAGGDPRRIISSLERVPNATLVEFAP